jgi:glycine/D-amino acid oxidase-like deaminating enzyme
MKFEFILVGQGISGTFLSYYLQKEKKSFIVIDNNDKNAPSRIAAGIINPVTGRRMVTVWMADEVFPFGWQAYHEIGNELNIAAISQRNIIDFFPNPFMRENFLKRLNEGNEYMQSIEEVKQYGHYFKYDFGCGEIKPVYMAHLETLLPAWRNKLKNENLLLEESFEVERLVISDDAVRWSDREGQTISAVKIIFCDGAGSFDSPYFKQLPFAPNKGEALIVEIPDLPTTNIYKKGTLLTPFLARPDHSAMGSEAVFWAGSNYSWEFDNADPTEQFRNNTEATLKEWLKVPFKVLDHRAGIRPATLERRPFAGLHPHFPSIGILNGMGTKGCSLAPFFAKQLADHLAHGKTITPEADISRFKKILTR